MIYNDKHQDGLLDDVGIIVEGRFTGLGLHHIVIVDGTLTALRYQRKLVNSLIMKLSMNKEEKKHLIFQQDNVSWHSSKTTIVFLSDCL